MNEDYKMGEAEFFFRKMVVAVETPEHFNYYLSAFLTAARSVLQYALKEAKMKQGGQGWYDGIVLSYQAIAFLKDKRDVSVHAQPVVAQTAIAIEDIVHVGIGEAVEVHIFQEGKLVGHHKSESSPAELPAQREPSTRQFSYHFKDLAGSDDDVLKLCRRYLDEIKTVLADGRRREFIS